MSSVTKQFDKLWALIDKLSNECQTATFSEAVAMTGKEAHWSRDKNLRDVLMHLYEWHQLFLNWTEANTNGNPSPFLPEPYNWRTYPEMNQAFWLSHQKTTLEEAQTKLFESHRSVMARIDHFSDEELFTKGRLSWTGTSTLGSYCVSVTASHYDWAIKKIKVHIRSYSGE